jgi:hypothetical protein
MIFIECSKNAPKLLTDHELFWIKVMNLLIEMTLYVENRIVGQMTRAPRDTSRGFSKQLEECLISLCRELGAPIPLWLSKNTKEFASFHQTLFTREQFDEQVLFDRMMLRMLS